MISKISLLLLTLIVLVGCSGTPTKAPPGRPTIDQLASEGLVLSLPGADNGIEYSGQLPLNGGGGSASAMMYPAPSAGAMVAAVLTHAAIATAMRSSQRSAEQDQADQVLEGYRDAFDAILFKDLETAALKNKALRALFKDAGNCFAGELCWQLKATPLYLIAQDKKAFIIENAISLIEAGAPEHVLYATKVKVIRNASLSGGVDVITPSALSLLATETFVESVHLFLKGYSLAGSQEKRDFKTFRYKQGSVQRYERGALMFVSNTRTTIRTLRDEILSFPTQ